jgi:hypothetical protein
VTSIGVKSKYGSCSGNCTGLININNTQKKRKVPFVGMTGWTVNSIAKAVKGSSPFLPKKIINLFYSVLSLNVLKPFYLWRFYFIYIYIK